MVCASAIGDIDVFFSELTRLVHAKSAKTPSWQLKVAVLGASESALAAVLRAFVDRFSARPQDWAPQVRLLLLPLFSGSSFGQLLASTSSPYRSLLDVSAGDAQIALSLVANCLLQATPRLELFSLPIGEVLLTIREKNADNRSRQLVLPFVADVQVVVTRGSLHHSGTSNNAAAVPSPSYTHGEHHHQQQQQQLQHQSVSSQPTAASIATSAGTSELI